MKIGSKVIALRHHPCGWYSKNKIYTVRNVRISPCLCKCIDIDIGICLKKDDDEIFEDSCEICGYMEDTEDPVFWFDSRNFREIDDLSDYLPEQLIEELETTNVITA